MCGALLLLSAIVQPRECLSSCTVTGALVVLDVYKYCSPTRSGIQSGRHPFHVNPINAAPDIYNPADPVSGFAAIPRNMTGIGTKLSAAGYKVSTVVCTQRDANSSYAVAYHCLAHRSSRDRRHLWQANGTREWRLWIIRLEVVGTLSRYTTFTVCFPLMNPNGRTFCAAHKQLPLRSFARGHISF